MTAPTGPRARSAILKTAVEMCAQGGFASVTMEGVATQVGVGKPTLYRWWPSKAHLMLDALLEQVSGVYFLIPDTGDFATDVRAWLRSFVDLFADDTLRALCIGVVSAHLVDPTMHAQMVERIHGPARAHNRARIIEAQSLGQLAEGDPDVIEDELIGPLWYRILVSGMPVTAEYVDQIASRTVARNA